MRKIAELNGDEFFDVIYCLSPILPMITEMEILQAQLFGNISPRIAEARETKNNPKATEKAKKQAEQDINAEIAGILARDISRIVPLLTSKQNRGIVFEMLSILERLPIEEIKQYPPPKLIAKLKQVISDTDFRSFLSYAEQSE